MKTNKACPDCGKALTYRNKCRCGWLEVAVNEDVFDDRCQFCANGKQCHLTGSMSSQPSGRTKTWYCFRHWQYQNDSHYDDNLNPFDAKSAQKILESRSEWRHYIFPEELRIKKRIRK